MLKKLHEEYRRYSLLSFHEKVEAGKASLKAIRDYFEREGKGEAETNRFLYSLVAAAVSGDRFASNEEYDFFNALFDTSLSFGEFFNLTNLSGEEEVSFLDKEMDALPIDIKKEACVLVSLFLLSDYRYSKEEEKLLAKLLG